VKPYTVVYALSRPSESCYHHVAYVVAAHVDEAIALCCEDALPGFSFCLIAAFDGHADRSSTGDGVVVHDFREPEGEGGDGR
jgi:hypothetical protein